MTNNPNQDNSHKNKKSTITHSRKEQKPARPETRFEKRTFAMTQVAGMIHQVTRPAFRKKNFVHTQIMTDWVDIIGAHYGNLSTPHQIYQGTLTIACSNATAAELYYISNSIMEKINLYCGKKIVTKIKFIYKRVQSSPLTNPQNAASSSAQPIPIHAIPPGPLQEALSRLGGQMQVRKKGKD